MGQAVTSPCHHRPWDTTPGRRHSRRRRERWRRGWTRRKGRLRGRRRARGRGQRQRHGRALPGRPALRTRERACAGCTRRLSMQAGTRRRATGQPHDPAGRAGGATRRGQATVPPPASLRHIPRETVVNLYNDRSRWGQVIRKAALWWKGGGVGGGVSSRGRESAGRVAFRGSIASGERAHAMNEHNCSVSYGGGAPVSPVRSGSAVGRRPQGLSPPGARAGQGPSSAPGAPPALALARSRTAPRQACARARAPSLGPRRPRSPARVSGASRLHAAGVAGCGTRRRRRVAGRQHAHTARGGLAPAPPPMASSAVQGHRPRRRSPRPAPFHRRRGSWR